MELKLLRVHDPEGRVVVAQQRVLAERELEHLELLANTVLLLRREALEPVEVDLQATGRGDSPNVRRFRPIQGHPVTSFRPRRLTSCAPMPHALSLPRVRTRRRRPPTFRRLLGFIWLAICLVSLAHAVMEIAAGKYLFVPIAAVWVVLYLEWRRISRVWERLDELGLPIPAWEMRLQLTLVSVQLLATIVLFIV